MSINEIKNAGILALKESHSIIRTLGESGKENIVKNKFNELSLKADIECEKAVIKILREKNIPVKIISEEHGVTIIGDKPKYTAVLDGLDGSNVYKKDINKGRYGTMLAVFSGLDPKYKDYIFSGAIEHAKNKLYFAVKNQGSFIMEKDEIIPIKCNSKIRLDKNGIIYIDEYFEKNRKIFSEKLINYNTKYLGSSCAYYIDLASGKADLVLECTRKGNLEIAVAFGLIVESGGIITAIDGISIAEKKYLEFGQNENIQIIAAPNIDMTNNLLEYL